MNDSTVTHKYERAFPNVWVFSESSIDPPEFLSFSLLVLVLRTSQSFANENLSIICIFWFRVNEAKHKKLVSDKYGPFLLDPVPTPPGASPMGKTEYDVKISLEHTSMRFGCFAYIISNISCFCSLSWIPHFIFALRILNTLSFFFPRTIKKQLCFFFLKMFFFYELFERNL